MSSRISSVHGQPSEQKVTSTLAVAAVDGEAADQPEIDEADRVLGVGDVGQGGAEALRRGTSHAASPACRSR